MKSPSRKPQSKKEKKKADGEEFKLKLEAELEAINQHYAVVQRGSHVHVMYEGFNAKGQREISYLQPRDFTLKIAHKKIWSEAEEKYIQLAPLWLSWDKRREYEGIYFYPGEDERPSYYNLWRGFTHAPSRNGQCDLFLAHVRDNICNGNPETYAWVMAWLSDIFQNPDRKPGTALVLRGEMGIGKGAFANHIGHLLGQHYLTVANASQVTGRFNSHMAEKILMFVDESFWSGEKVGAGVLRALITEPQQSSEMKGRDIIMVDSFLRLVIAANDEWVVPVGMKDERRFTVLDVGNAQQRQYEYFKAIDEQLKNGGYGALLDTFLNWQFETNLPRTIVETEALLDQKLHSMKDEYKWWMGCLKDARIIAGSGWPDGDYGIATSDLYQAYSTWCDEMRVKKKLSSIGLPRSIQKCTALRKTRVDNANHYTFAEVDYHRADFERFIGHDIDWDNV